MIGFRLAQRDRRNLGQIRATGLAKNNTEAMRIAIELASTATHDELATALARRNRVEVV